MSVRRSSRLSSITSAGSREGLVDFEEDIENISWNKMRIIKKRESTATKKETAVSEPKTPTRRKRDINRSKKGSSIDGSPETLTKNADAGVSPPKQGKFERNAESLFSPSRLMNRLSIEDSDQSEDDGNYDLATKALPSRSKYQNARQVLNSGETDILPGRENELSELSKFLNYHLDNSTSGSLYVSGQPGTGKTACLSKILKSQEFRVKFIKVYINCTSISTIGSIYKKIANELQLKVNGKTEKDNLHAIEKYLTSNHKMVLMVLDEIDQLVGKKQTILYTLFEWPSNPKSKLILIGIANSLDLTDRLLTRLNANCNLKPKLMHFSPYSKDQIINIFKSRLEEAGVMDIFPPVTIQLLAGKVAAVSGDVRRALDIGRRVVEIADKQKPGSKLNFKELGLEDDKTKPKNRDEKIEEFQPVQMKQVISVLNNVYGASQTLNDDIEDGFPLQQKILVCSLLLMLRKEKNKDITVGRLHDVYKRVCMKRNLLAVDQSEFGSLCDLVETRGILKVIKKKEPRLSKIVLQWDEEEVTSVFKDKQLIATILDDASCLQQR